MLSVLRYVRSHERLFLPVEESVNPHQNLRCDNFRDLRTRAFKIRDSSLQCVMQAMGDSRAIGVHAYQAKLMIPLLEIADSNPEFIFGTDY